MDISAKVECQRYIVSLVDTLLKDNLNTHGAGGSFIRDIITCEYDFSFKLIDNETGEEI